MRLLHIIALLLAGMFFAGCSKNSGPQTQAMFPTNEADAASFLTNSLKVLRTTYNMNETNILQVKVKLDALRRQYNITDISPTQLDQINQSGEKVITSQQPYWDEKRKLAGMIAFQRRLEAKIMTSEIDRRLPKAQ